MLHPLVLQIWIKPARKGGKPRYDQNPVEAGSVDGRLGLLLSGSERLPGITINQDARVYAAKLDGADSVEYTVNRGRHAWLQVARGSLRVNGTRLQTGDAVATSRPTRLVLDQANRARDPSLRSLLIRKRVSTYLSGGQPRKASLDCWLLPRLR